MHNTIVKPQTPDSADILVNSAGNYAFEKRQVAQNKTIMDCFRDRTPGYNNNRRQQFYKYETNNHTAEATVFLKQPTTPTRLAPARSTNKLALLKSSSSKEINRLMADTNSSTASSSSSTRSAPRNEQHTNFGTTTIVLDNSFETQQRVQNLEERVAELTSELNRYKDLQVLIYELARRVEDLEISGGIGNFQRKRSIRKKNPRRDANPSGSGGAGGGSGVQPSKFIVWMKLTNLWKHRPSIETLKEQNIYNDEPCFDTEIDNVLKHEVYKTVPKIVVDCCDLIEEKFRRSSEPVDGVYRQCGDYNKIQSLRFKIDANDYDALTQTDVDIHTLTGLLKLFLREIKTPLVSANEAKTFIGTPNQWLLTDQNAKIEILKRLIRSLPQVNRDTMEYLFEHFNRLTKVPLQHTSAETLSLSLCPSIFHTVMKGNYTQDIEALVKENEILADCVKIMIQYHNRIFEESRDQRRQRRISVRRLRKTLSHPDLLFQNLF